MRNEETKLSSRILAGFLTMIMVLSLIPFSAIPAMAATAGHDDAVTITVTEEDGKTPIAGATVTITVVDAISEASVVDNVAKTTDANGVVEVMTSGDIGDFLTINGEGELTVSATVTADDHEDGSLAGTVINSPNDNYIVRLVSTKITDVTIVANTGLEYDGTAQSLVTVNEKPGDTVKYKLDGVDVAKAEAVDAGTYAVEVTVTRAGKDPLTVKFDGVENSKISIAQAPISGIVVECEPENYSKSAIKLASISGFEADDIVTIHYDGNDYDYKTNCPEMTDVGTYSFTVTVHRNDNYKDFDNNGNSYTKQIKAVAIDGLSAELYSGEGGNNPVYDATEHNAILSVTRQVGEQVIDVTTNDDYTVEYKMSTDNGEGGWIDGTWTTYVLGVNVPTVKDAGKYRIEIRVSIDSDNYTSPTTVELNPATITVEKASQTIDFVQDVPASVTIDTENSNNNNYDFSAQVQTVAELSENGIQYSLIDASSEDVATINDSTGMLTVQNAGIITVKALRAGNNNYKDAVAYATVTVVMGGNGLVNFDAASKTYYLDENGTASEEIATKAHDDDNGSLTYTINKTNVGLAIDSSTGKVTISDRKTLFKEMGKNGSVVITVTVNKTAGTVTEKEWYFNNLFDWGTREITKEIYDASTATYVLTVLYDDAPSFESVCNITDPDENTGWYNATHQATITPLDSSKYLVALDSPEVFEESVSITDQGTDPHYIYLKDKSTRRICAAIEVNIKVDTISPTGLKVEYAKSPTDSFLEIITLGFYNPSVTIKFTATDSTSSLDRVVWEYTRTDGTSDFSNETYTDTWYFEDGVAQKTVSADEAGQFRGSISKYTVYDKAGNASETDDNGNVFVIDTFSPVLTVKYNDASFTSEEDGRRYYGNDKEHKAVVKFVVTEANFDLDCVEIRKINADDPSDNGTVIDAVWDHTTWNSTLKDVYTGTVEIVEEGNYYISFKYTEQANNSLKYKDGDEEPKALDEESWKTCEITIDKTAPEISFVYNGKEDDNKNQSVTFTIVEHNFDPNSIEFDFEANDITGKRISSYANQGAKLIQTLKGKLESVNWTHDGDSHSITIDDFADAVYNLKVRYKDLALNAYTTDGTPGNEEFETGEFIIDHTKPTNVEISYSDAYVNPWDTVVGILTLGFYNPKNDRPVTITFVTTDDTSGIDHFDWSYKRTDGVSEVKNLAELSGTIKDSDISRNGNTFTASITLPKDTADQLRGSITVSATDNKANKSETVTDSGKVIVVDSISPEMTVAYSESSRTLPSGEMLYNKAATATFTVTEANFFKEDVKVTVSKNGGTPYSVTPSWVDNSTDEHIGTLVLAAASDHSNDGHYVINVTYTDRSNNTMTSYKSNTITIDTIAPTIAVKYDDDKVPVVQTLEDNVHGNAANDRKYYADQKVATITVVEHNFDANEVEFTIVAKDITGTVLSSHSGPKPATDPNLIKFGTWSSSGDTHTITITYPGDANYEFDVAYTDLATNEAADYATDYFTVDKTAPTNITVDYSTSVLDTVLNSLTFGFYNAKMTVTITADDETSSVRSFLYNYRNAAGVSAVNAELINQALEEANGDIKYSNDGKTATISFEIPKMVLGNDNQFNGTVDFTATDRSDNETKHEETKRVVVDNIAPTAQVAYNESTNKVGDIDYYNGNIEATVTITEANFYSDDVVITVTKDGAAYNVATNWTDNSVDVHVGRFTLTEDGDYIITINYKDKSSNTMTEYKSNQLTIDTKIEEPTYTINNVARSGDDGKAYKSDATVEFNFEDQNFDTKTITLTRKRYNDETVVYDSEKTGVNDFGVKLNMNDKGGSGTITIPEEVANDGIYTLKITMTDKALHPTESYVKFAITRFGSVYEYNDVLADLIKDGGQYVKSIEKDLIIKEYNAVPITNESLKITITRDGEAIDVDYTSDPTDGKQFETVGIGNSGWYEYVYTIKAANFAEDGVYNITLSSLYDALDASGNSVSTSSTSVPDNSIDADGNKVLDVMKFTVDDTAPEIRNVINLDKEIADRDQIIDGKLTVTYTIIDVGGLKTIEIIVNGSTLDTISEFEDASSYTGTFDLNESSDKQTVQIKVTDLAGNVTDTANDAFKNAHKTSDDPYVFNDTITVSTNFFVRWYANTPLFWGSIGGVVLVAGGSGAAIAAKRKKKAKA